MTHHTPSADQIRDFVIASHGNLDKVKQMLAEHPQLLNTSHPWTENDRETPIQAAAQVGNVAIAEHLLQRGAPMDICTAASLGRKVEVERLLEEDPTLIKSTGAHDIPLLTHGALSGNLELVRLLFERGAQSGQSAALHNAVSRGYRDIVRWIVENAKPDLTWKDYRGKTALAIATEMERPEIAKLLRNHGAME